MAKVFRADKIQIDRCDNPACSNVHISLFDGRDIMRADAIIPKATVALICSEMIQCRDWKPGDPPIGLLLN